MFEWYVERAEKLNEEIATIVNHPHLETILTMMDSIHTTPEITPLPFTELFPRTMRKHGAMFLLIHDDRQANATKKSNLARPIVQRLYKFLSRYTTFGALPKSIGFDVNPRIYGVKPVPTEYLVYLIWTNEPLTKYRKALIDLNARDNDN